MTDEPRSPDPEDRKETRAERETRSTWQQVAKYSQIGFLLPAATLVGWLIGAALDRWLGTTWIYLAGLVLGTAAGFVAMFRELSQEMK